MRKLWLLLVSSLLSGCAPARPPAVVEGPRQLSPVLLDHWPDAATAPGRRVVTPHYILYSTIADWDIVGEVAQVMEGALGEYRRLAPEVPLTKEPMECYVFGTRKEWADFTKMHTGDDAAVYLQINRGGYTVGDWYVAYFIGTPGTYSVAAHEGWHQYAARHLRGRLPPFLEEGLACLFEDVRWEGDLPRWNLSVNPARQVGLEKAVAAGHLYPLPELIRIHAGQVVGRSRADIEAFYAQSWAFARFLWDGEGGRYRGALRKMLTDSSLGRLYADTSPHLPGGQRTAYWDPKSAKPMLEHYLGADLNAIDRRYQAYLRQLATRANRFESDMAG